MFAILTLYAFHFGSITLRPLVVLHVPTSIEGDACIFAPSFLPSKHIIQSQCSWTHIELMSFNLRKSNSPVLFEVIVQVRRIVVNAETAARTLLHVPAAEMELPDGGVVTDEEGSPVAKIWTGEMR